MFGCVDTGREVVALLGDSDVVARFRELEVERRRREVETALLVGEIERRGLYEPDGMRTVEAWCRAIGRWSRAEARQVHRVSRLLRNHPEVVAAAAAGRMPVAHLREIARGH